MKRRNRLGSISKKVARLGFFVRCTDKPPCEKGFERVVTKRDSRGVPLVCLCRLAANTRKKFRSKKYLDQTEEQRTPVGSSKKPVHLRRCIKFDEKGDCVNRGLPGLVAKDPRRGSKKNGKS